MKKLTAVEATYATDIIYEICGNDREGNAILVGEIKGGRWTLTGDKAKDVSAGRERLGNYDPAD